MAKCDIDSNPQIPSQFEIRSIPTLLLFKDGKVVGQLIGAVPKAKLEDMVKKVIPEGGLGDLIRDNTRTGGKLRAAVRKAGDPGSASRTGTPSSLPALPACL